jgi:Uma2 family endonuclease
MATISPVEPDIEYPDSDGNPMSDNTRQFRWIVTIQGGLDALFMDDPNVFVAGDLLWYPVEGNNKVRSAPDAMVVLGRPKGDRGSYQQWKENGVAPQVVFEVTSPGNRQGQLVEKFRFYDRYNVEEYYLYDPDDGVLSGWKREAGELVLIDPIVGFTSPLLGIRFELVHGELEIYRPDGRRFASYLELEEQRAQAQRAAESAQRAAETAQRAAETAQRALSHARRETEELRSREERLAARLRALGVDPDEEPPAPEPPPPDR